MRLKENLMRKSDNFKTIQMSKISLIQGDITKIEADAIVNAANKSLLGGGGVDGAIHRAAGKDLLDESAKLNGCQTGESKITKGYNLPAKNIIHTVGPVWNGGNKDETQLLENCYTNSLKLARENKLKTIAFPNISTGIYRFPKRQAARIAIDTVKKYFKKTSKIKEVIFVVFDEENYRLYDEMLNSK